MAIRIISVLLLVLALGLGIVALRGRSAARTEPAPTPAPTDRAAGPGIPRPAEFDALPARLRAAIEAAEERVRTTPDRPDAWADLARLLQAEGHHATAIACWDRAIELEDADAVAWYLLADARRANGDETGALEALDASLRLDPGYAPGHARRGDWLLEADRLDDADAAFRAATEAVPNDAAGWLGLARVALARGDGAAALAPLDRAASVDPRQAPYAALLRSRALSRLGRDVEAEAAANEGRGAERQVVDPRLALLQSGGASVDAAIGAIERQIDSGRADLALDAVRALRADDPDRYSLLMLECRALRELDREEEAIALLEAKLRERPEEPALHLMLGTSLMRRLGRLPERERTAVVREAGEHLAAAYAGDPTSIGAAGAWGDFNALARRAAPAASAYDRAASLDPGNASWCFKSGVMLVGLGERDEAIARFRAATRRDPGHAAAWYNLGATLTEADPGDEARNALLQARRLIERPLRPRAADEPALDVARVEAALHRLAAAEAAP